ncbi:MAG: GNAT family N-acetyltransferase, partial [Chloroflexota bacterium]|nr:GNAT family N-acetyltransferase [Chloroflexota bacterium]
MTDEMRHISGDRGITTVVLMRGEERLSSTEVIPMTMQVGHARLRMDGIGGVATAEEHRYKGYSRRVLE